MAAANVTVIPATFNPMTRKPTTQLQRRRVAGYARVSTDSDEQFTSYEAQVDYYTNYITSNAEWEFIKVYTDEGISGLNTKKRDGFNQMIEDALGGKIDLIVTKSVSRFARNTVDSLTTIRKLKEHGTEVYFEKEAIWTFDSKGELLLTIMSSLAQEESRSISENITWGKRKQFSDGKVSLPYKQFLGYRKGADGLPEIVPEEAETVRRIYRLFMEGKSVSFIAKQLTREGIPTPGGNTQWQMAVVKSILTNEKYKGDALLQKRFTADFLTKRMKTNEGEVPQYYVRASHPAIIAPAEWDRVQNELSRRQASRKRVICGSPFSGMLTCGDCGAVYGSKVWHSNDPYREVIWQCNGKFKGDKKCRTPHLSDDEIKNAYRLALSALLSDRDALCDDIRAVKRELTDCSGIDSKLQAVAAEQEVVAGLVRQCVEGNASAEQSQADYMAHYSELADRYEHLTAKQEALQNERREREIKADTLSGFLFDVGELPELDIAFSEQRWRATVDHVTVYHDGRLVFSFKNGSDITVEM